MKRRGSLLLVVGALAAGLLAAPAEAAYPGKPGSIAFSRYLSASNAEVFSMSPLGATQTNLTNTLGMNEIEVEPSYSGDGRRFAYYTFVGGNYEIYTANADGSGPVNLTNTAAEGEFAPTLSADGKRVAFLRIVGGGFDVFSMGADGSNPVNLTQTPAAVEGDPAFSPDDRRIALSRDTGTMSDIWVMAADGSGAVNLTNSPGVADDRPAFSPDGRQVVWQRLPRRRRANHIQPSPPTTAGLCSAATPAATATRMRSSP
jgi:Tol biopolymer transport system component